jgi:serine protease Do
MGTQVPADAMSRLPCPFCAEPIALEARLCHHCQSSVLVDVGLSAVVTDPRLRYQVARAIRALPGAPPLTDIQAALTSTTPAAVRGVTRAFAHEVLALLTQHGLRGSIAAQPISPPAATRSSLRAWLGGAGVLFVLLTGFTAWKMVLGDLGKPVPPPTSGPAVVPVRAPQPANAGGLTARDVARRSLPSTVSIRCRESVGSGFFVTNELVLTNAHVLCPPSETAQVVLSDGRKLVGTTERSNTTVDLGLVRVKNAGVVPLPLGDVADLAPGDKLTIIGSPVGLEFTVHEGSVSSLARSVRGIAYVQLDAKINPGNSGGPVIDAEGRVVGIVTLKHAGAEGIGLAVPINYAYDPRVGFAAAPSPQAAASAAFAQMVTRAKQLGESDLAAPDSGPGGELFADRPMLVAASVDEYRRLVIRVVRIAKTPPRYEEVAVKVWHGTEAFCTIKGDISTWKEINEANTGTPLPPALREELAKNGGGSLYLGESPLRWDLCNRSMMVSGIVIELQGANPAASRLTLS